MSMPNVVTFFDLVWSGGNMALLGIVGVEVAV